MLGLQAGSMSAVPPSIVSYDSLQTQFAQRPRKSQARLAPFVVGAVPNTLTGDLFIKDCCDLVAQQIEVSLDIAEEGASDPRF